MNKFLLALPLTLIVGCASKPAVIEVEKAPTPTPPVQVAVEDAKIGKYNGPVALSRSEVIEGSRDCVNSKMKPTVEYLSQKTGKGMVLVPVNVHCDPYK
jgi:hypothetical protein